MTRHLITSALPYINGVKHLGNLVGSMLPADIYARYLRLRGEEVLFICATDEHGTPAELAANEPGCRWPTTAASSTRSRRTSASGFGLDLGPLRPQLVAAEPRAHPALRPPARRRGLHRGACHQAGVLAGRRPLPARPLHRRHLPALRLRQRPRRPVRELHPGARPDRPPRAALGDLRQHRPRGARDQAPLPAPVEARRRGRAWIEAHDDWPALTTSIARKWLDEGLHDRGITRDLDWGVPVRSTGPASRARSSTSGSTPRSSTSAPPPSGPTPAGPRLEELVVRRRRRRVHAVHGQGQRAVPHGVVPGHAHRLPASRGSRPTTSRASTGSPTTAASSPRARAAASSWTRPSTSSRRLLALVPVRQRAESSDSSFTWEQFAVAVNKDLADSFGNLVNRCLTLSAKHYGPVVPAGGEPGEREPSSRPTSASRGGLHRPDGGQGAAEVGQRAAPRWALANAYWEQSEPWKVVKADPTRRR